MARKLSVRNAFHSWTTKQYNVTARGGGSAAEQPTIYPKFEGSIPATAGTGIDKINENQGDKSVNVIDNVVYLLIQVPSLLIKNIFITIVVVVAVVDMLFVLKLVTTAPGACTI